MGDERELNEYEEFNKRKQQEVNKDKETHIDLESALSKLISEVENKKKQEKKNSHIWWGARKTAEMSVIVAVLWWSLQNNAEINKTQLINLQNTYERNFNYFDNKINSIIKSVGKTTLGTEQSILVMRDAIKIYHYSLILYLDKILTARYPQECVKDTSQEYCEKRISSELEKNNYYLVSKLNKFSSEKGLLGDYFNKSYPSKEFLNNINRILFSKMRKNYKISSIKILMSDSETDYIRQFQKSLDNK